MKNLLAAAALCLLAASAAEAECLTKVVVPAGQAEYAGRFAEAIGAAKTALKGNRPAGCVTGEQWDYRIVLQPGTYNTKPAGEKAAFELIGINNADDRELVIVGAGMNETRVDVPLYNRYVFTKDSRNIRFSNIHFHTPGQLLVTQGRITRKYQEGGVWFVDVKLDAGYPQPHTLDDGEDSGKFIKRYKVEGGVPYIVKPCSAEGTSCSMDTWVKQPGETNPQYNRRVNSNNKWVSSEGTGDAAKIRLSTSEPHLQVDDLVAVKGKIGGDAYIVRDSDKFSFTGIKWTQRTRGAFVCTQNVQIKDSRIERMKPGAALASGAGGPQVGGHPQYSECPSGGHVITGNHFDAAGDDAIAIFYIDKDKGGAKIENNTIVPGFDRSILVFDGRGNDLEPEDFPAVPSPVPAKYNAVTITGNKLEHGAHVKFMCTNTHDTDSSCLAGK